MMFRRARQLNGCFQPGGSQLPFAYRACLSQLLGLALTAFCLTVAAPLQAAAQSNGNAALTQRIEQLEQQVVDLQVVIGTLETIAQSGGGAAGANTGPGAGGSDNFVLETKINAMARQLEALTAQVRRQSQSRAGNPAVTDNSAQRSNLSAGGPSGAVAGDTPPGPRVRAPAADFASAPDANWGTSSAPTQDWNADAASPAPTKPDTTVARRPARSTPQSGGGANSPAALADFRAAYNFILGRDFDQAEGAFEKFVAAYPQHKLAGNAQFWIGEARYRRGEYGEAARAFYKGFLTYDQSSKWHNSVLKLAMSLSRSGEKKAACKLLGDFDVKYADAEANLRRTANREKKRARCPGAS